MATPDQPAVWVESKELNPKETPKRDFTKKMKLLESVLFSPQSLSLYLEQFGAQFVFGLYPSPSALGSRVGKGGMCIGREVHIS